jgi:hypothetical protein
MDKTAIAEAAVLDRSQQQAPSLRALDDTPNDEAAFVPHLGFEPGSGRTAGQIRGRRVLTDVPLNPAGQHFLPGFASIARQPADGEDEGGALHEPFPYVPALLQGLCPEVTAAGVEDVEGDEDRPSRRHVRTRITEQIEARHEPLIEHRDLAVEHEGRTRQRRDSLDQVGEADSMLDALPADKA